MKKIFLLIILILFNFQNLYSKEMPHSKKFDKFLQEFSNRGGSNEAIDIFKKTYTEIYSSGEVSLKDFNKFKLKLLPIFFSLKSKDQKILWQIYINQESQINRQIENYKKTIS